MAQLIQHIQLIDFGIQPAVDLDFMECACRELAYGFGQLQVPFVGLGVLLPLFQYESSKSLAVAV